MQSKICYPYYIFRENQNTINKYPPPVVWQNRELELTACYRIAGSGACEGAGAWRGDLHPAELPDRPAQPARELADGPPVPPPRTRTRHRCQQGQQFYHYNSSHK